MLSDIEIAQQAQPEPITRIASQLGIKEEELELYGRYKAKLSDSLIRRISGNRDGKLILVTAINPTPAGEGKTTVSVGLAEAMAKIGKKLFSLCASLRSAQFSALRAALRAEAMHRLFRWKTSTSISLVTSMPSHPPTTSFARCLTTTFSRATNSELIPAGFFFLGAWI